LVLLLLGRLIFESGARERLRADGIGKFEERELLFN
jgi:hypothetical protein